jgi:hypothetical protein
MTSVALRKVPGTLALALLAALLAHTGLYGREHAVAGGYHGLVTQLAFAAAWGFIVMVAAIAWNSRGVASEGSVLAARLTTHLPSFSPTVVAAALWFALFEQIEPHHAVVGAPLIVLALSAAAWLVTRLARSLVAALAGLIIAVARHFFRPRAPSWSPVPRLRLLALRLLRARRRFARPPPTASLIRA